MEYESFVASNLAGHVTKFAPHKAVKLIASGSLTFDEKAVLHRAMGWGLADGVEADGNAAPPALSGGANCRFKLP